MYVHVWVYSVGRKRKASIKVPPKDCPRVATLSGHFVFGKEAWRNVVNFLTVSGARKYIVF